MIPEILISTLLSLTPAEKSTIDNLESLLKKDGYDISQYLNDPRFRIYRFDKERKSINYADTTKSWYMKKDSIERCADFVEEYYHYLKKAEEKYGPSPEHITSQLELETNRGQYTGERALINSFISVYLDRPDRRKEFYKYISDFLDIFSDTTDNIIFPKDIFDVKGSWAGAHGIAQGMPGIIKKYGKDSDGDGDGYFNPMNVPDAIFFMASYLSDHGFKKNSSNAVQKYNPNDKFYGSSIGEHTKELIKIMEKRRRMPIETINYKINPLTINVKYPEKRNLKEIKINSTNPIIPTKISFIKRIYSNFKTGKRV